jgi:hypothetical protein
MTVLVGTLEGGAEISLSAIFSIWVVEGTGLCTETGSSLPIVVLIAVEMVTAVDIIDIVPGSWAFGTPFTCAKLMGGVAEWSVAMSTPVTKEGTAEESPGTNDKGAPTISEVVEWSAVVPMLALVAKEGITERSTNEGAALISGVAGRSTIVGVISSIGTRPAT